MSDAFNERRIELEWNDNEGGLCAKTDRSFKRVTLSGFASKSESDGAILRVRVHGLFISSVSAVSARAGISLHTVCSEHRVATFILKNPLWSRDHYPEGIQVALQSWNA